MRSFFGRMRSDGNQDPVTAGWSRDVTVELRSMRGLIQAWASASWAVMRFSTSTTSTRSVKRSWTTSSTAAQSPFWISP